jgi:hypothetical protein
MKMLSRREFLMSAHTLKPDKNTVDGWWISEKLDGSRCFWDGGISRGVPTVEVPYANIFHPKKGGLKPNLKPVATGLWSRYANPIIAPDSFLNQLPSCFLDGELFAGRGNFQKCRSIVAGNTAGPDWKDIEYCVYGSPSYASIFATGRIKIPQMVRDFDFDEIDEWINIRRKYGERLIDLRYLERQVSFRDELTFLDLMMGEGYVSDCVSVVNQRALPETDPYEYLWEYFNRILDLGGEGIMVRDSEQVWHPKRQHGILKCKPSKDDEAVVVGFTCGRETDKGSKLLGMIGSLITNYKGKRLELAGLTNEERHFGSIVATDWAERNPGQDMPNGIDSKHFKLGDTVTFKYRELSDDGIPKDARYWRKR